MRPSLPRHTVVWDVQQVLEYIGNGPMLHDLTLLQLSQHLATLLALLSGQEGPDHTLDSLREYLLRTKTIRKQESRLFITSTRPYRAISRATLSKWIKATLSKARMNMNMFSAHST